MSWLGVVAWATVAREGAECPKMTVDCTFMVRECDSVAFESAIRLTGASVIRVLKQHAFCVALMPFVSPGLRPLGLTSVRGRHHVRMLSSPTGEIQPLSPSVNAATIDLERHFSTNQAAVIAMHIDQQVQIPACSPSSTGGLT